MRVIDWRTADAADVDDMFAAEILRWHDALGWDAGETWQQVDDARRAGVLHGYVALDASGRIAGWTFFLRDAQALQIGALNSTAPGVAGLLLDAVLASPLAEDASSTLFFGFPNASDVDTLLAARGFDVERYLYLERSTAGFTASPQAASWRDSRRDAVATLLSESYDGDRSRAFARDGGFDGWRDYVHKLVTTVGCGRFLAEGCQLIERDDDRLDAVVLTTRIGTHTVHVPQVAVARHARGRGLAAQLLGAALGAAHDAGYTRATLLVGERNASARRVYTKLGFLEKAAFISARKECASARQIGQTLRDQSLVLGS